MNTGHELRIAAGVSFDWKGLPPMVDALDGVPRDAEQLTFRRQGKSHRGIAELRNLRRLWAYQERDGRLIPAEGEVAWLLPSGPYPYWRGKLESISFEPAH